MGRLDNRVAIITGGTSGIGEATAEVFVEVGATVIISGRSEEKGQAIATPIFWGGSSRANTLSDEENARKMEKLQGNLARATPLQKSGLAQDIAYAALYLASDEGRFVNCHDLVVDGGRTAMFNEPG